MPNFEKTAFFQNFFVVCGFQWVEQDVSAFLWQKTDFFHFIRTIFSGKKWLDLVKFLVFACANALLLTLHCEKSQILRNRKKVHNMNNDNKNENGAIEISTNQLFILYLLTSILQHPGKCSFLGFHLLLFSS